MGVRNFVAVLSVFAPIISFAGAVVSSDRAMDRQLEEAVKVGALAEVEALLQAGANANASVVPENGPSILSHAIKRGDLNILQALFRMGVRIDSIHPGDHGATPMRVALRTAPRLEVAQALFTQGIRQTGSVQSLLELNFGEVYCEASLALRSPQTVGAKALLEKMVAGSEILQTGELCPGTEADPTIITDDPTKLTHEALVLVVTHSCINLSRSKL
jgi:hypothetical protein